MDFEFNGINKPYIYILQGMERSAWAPLTREIAEVPGRAGGRLKETKTNVRTITVPVMIKRDGFSDLQKVKEDLGGWLITEKPEKLIFDDEPDRYYMAVVDGELELEEMVRWGKGTITFICPDPYKYGKEKQAVRIKKLTWEEYKGRTWEEVGSDGN